MFPSSSASGLETMSMNTPTTSIASISPFSTATASLSWRIRSQISRIPPPSLLFCLPPELLLSVCDFLSWDDVACFSLCNQQLFATISKVWNNLKNSNAVTPRAGKERLPLLCRLERDLPNHYVPFLCLCYRLHKFDSSWDYRPRPGKLPWPPSRDRTKSCRPQPAWYDGGVSFNQPVLVVVLYHSDWWDLPLYQYLDLRLYDSAQHVLHYHVPEYHLHFSHVQLVMKRFRHGPQFGISPDVLSCVQVRPYPKELESVGTDPQLEVTSLFSADARVCCQPPVLVLRIQQILFTSRQFRLRLSCELGLNWYDAPTRPRPGWYICKHIEYNELAPLVNAHVSSYRAKRRIPLSDFSCDLCKTCFRIEFCECHENDVALIITKWINLGSGLRPDDPQWVILSQDTTSTTSTTTSRSDHYYYNSTMEYYYRDRNQTLRGFLRPEEGQLDDLVEVDNVRTFFEKSSANTFSVLRDRNLSYLKDHQYRQTMSQEAFMVDGTWSIWGGSEIS